MPAAGGLNEAMEKLSRGLIVLKGAFRMPLHGQDVVPGKSAFDSLNDPVIRAPCADAQTIAHNLSGLMVAGVYWDGARTIGASNFIGQQRVGLNYHRMNHTASQLAGMRDGGFNVLQQ